MKKFWIYAVAAVIGYGALIASNMPLYAALKGAPVPFSADWINYEDGQRQESGKYYAGGEGIRLEGIAGGEPYIIIYNFQRMVAWNLIESERMYVETAMDSDDLGLDDLGQFGSPCPPEARATRGGSETLGGRRTEKWTCAVPGEGVMTVWYDARLQAPIRSEDEDGRFELTNIREGRQPASLFVPPPGYTKMEVPSFGMPGGSSSGDRQSGSMQEMMRGMMQEQGSEPGRERQQPESDDARPGMQESLRGLFGR